MLRLPAQFLKCNPHLQFTNTDLVFFFVLLYGLGILPIPASIRLLRGLPNDRLMDLLAEGILRPRWGTGPLAWSNMLEPYVLYYVGAMRLTMSVNGGSDMLINCGG